MGTPRTTRPNLNISVVSIWQGWLWQRWWKLNASLQVVSVTYNDSHSRLNLIHTFLIYDSFYAAIFLADAQPTEIHTSSSSLQCSELFHFALLGKRCRRTRHYTSTLFKSLKELDMWKDSDTKPAKDDGNLWIKQKEMAGLNNIWNASNSDVKKTLKSQIQADKQINFKSKLSNNGIIQNHNLWRGLKHWLLKRFVISDTSTVESNKQHNTTAVWLIQPIMTTLTQILSFVNSIRQLQKTENNPNARINVS